DSSNYLTLITADSTSPRSDHRDQTSTPHRFTCAKRYTCRWATTNHQTTRPPPHTQRYPPRHAGPDSQSPIAGSRPPQRHRHTRVCSAPTAPPEILAPSTPTTTPRGPPVTSRLPSHARPSDPSGVKILGASDLR